MSQVVEREVVPSGSSSGRAVTVALGSFPRKVMERSSGHCGVRSLGLHFRVPGTTCRR